MTQKVTKVRVFVASPSDVQKERDSIVDVVDEINNTIGGNLGFVVELVRWETHCYPAMGRTQGVITAQIGTYDIFVGVMWKRFGTPTGKAESGTQEEFNLAYDEWKRNRKLHVCFYFSQAKYKLNSVTEADQNAKVLTFKEELHSKGLVWEYSNATSFPHLLRRHLTSILFEMFQKQTPTPEAKAGVIEKLHAIQEELDKASPNYRLVVNSAGEFRVEPKHSEANVQEPLKISSQFVFPDTAEGREMRAKLERALAAGTPITIPKEYIKYFKLPDVFSPLINTFGEGIETVTIGGFEPQPIVPVKLLLIADDGEEFELDYIQLEKVYGDVERIILANDSQPVPWKIKVTLNLQEGTLSFNYAVNYAGLTAKRELEAMRFTNALSSGGMLEIIHLDTGFTFQTITVTPGVIPQTDPKFFKLVEKTAFIQRKTRVPIVIPEGTEENPIRAEEVAVVYETAQRLETGRAVLSIQSWQTHVDLDLAGKLLDLFEQGRPISLSSSFEDETVSIFGKSINLGLVVFTCERTIMNEEDLNSLRNAVNAKQRDNILVRFTPFEGAPMFAHYPKWLQPEDRDFLLGQMHRAEQQAGTPSTKTPARRAGTLKGTVKYMAPDFDAPLDDFKEYME